MGKANICAKKGLS